MKKTKEMQKALKTLPVRLEVVKKETSTSKKSLEVWRFNDTGMGDILVMKINGEIDINNLSGSLQIEDRKTCKILFKGPIERFYITYK